MEFNYQRQCHTEAHNILRIKEELAMNGFDVRERILFDKGSGFTWRCIVIDPNEQKHQFEVRNEGLFKYECWDDNDVQSAFILSIWEKLYYYVKKQYNQPV